MKRQTYRRGLKELEREKRKKTRREGPVLRQTTTEFDPDAFTETRPTEHELELRDTTEIFYETQKRRQWFWSKPESIWQWLLVIAVIMGAVLLAIWMIPKLAGFFADILSQFELFQATVRLVSVRRW